MSQESLARKLRVLRAERGWTLREVFEKSGVDKVTLSYAERGLRKPYTTTLAKLAEVYDVSLEELLDAADERAEAPGNETPEELAPPKELSLSSLSLRNWLRGHGAKYSVMSLEQFAEYVVSQDPEIDEHTGQPLVIERIALEMDEEKEHIRKALNKDNVRGRLNHLLPNASPTQRAGAIWRFINVTLRDHYADLNELLIQFSHDIAAQRQARGQTWDVLAPSERHAQAWLLQTMDAALDRIKEAEASSAEAAKR